MGYYDSVKDSVREEGSKSDDGPNIDQLRESAEKNSQEDEEGDDTPIEVLEEEGLSRKKTEKKSVPQKESNNEGMESNDAGNPFTSESEVEEKLDKLIEQNERMIEILESFGS